VRGKRASKRSADGGRTNWSRPGRASRQRGQSPSGLTLPWDDGGGCAAGGCARAVLLHVNCFSVHACASVRAVDGRLAVVRALFLVRFTHTVRRRGRPGEPRRTGRSPPRCRSRRRSPCRVPAPRSHCVSFVHGDDCGASVPLLRSVTELRGCCEQSMPHIYPGMWAIDFPFTYHSTDLLDQWSSSQLSDQQVAGSSPVSVTFPSSGFDRDPSRGSGEPDSARRETLGRSLPCSTWCQPEIRRSQG
jgi:hypothetical protein